MVRTPWSRSYTRRGKAQARSAGLPIKAPLTESSLSVAKRAWRLRTASHLRPFSRRARSLGESRGRANVCAAREIWTRVDGFDQFEPHSDTGCEYDVCFRVGAAEELWKRGGRLRRRAAQWAVRVFGGWGGSAGMVERVMDGSQEDGARWLGGCRECLKRLRGDGREGRGVVWRLLGRDERCS